MKTKNKIIYWTPRIISILFLLFLAMFSLDLIEPGKGVLEIIGGMLMHNIPVFVLGTLLGVAWKIPRVGTITFLVAGIVYLAIVSYTMIKNGFEWHYLAWIAQISGACFVLSWLWWKNEKKKKKITIS